MKPEFKTFNLEVKEVEEKGNTGILRGYASTFGNVDLGLDVVDKGAFKKTLKESKGRFPILADHDWAKHIGFNVEAEEDEKGLLVEGEINLEVAAGKEKFSLAKQALKLKAKMGLSIGYMTIKAEPDSKNPSIRRLKELKLYEWSPTAFPMNVEAMVTGAKSLSDIDKAQFLLTQLKEQGIGTEILEMALAQNALAAKKGYDPAIGQSFDRMIQMLGAGK